MIRTIQTIGLILLSQFIMGQSTFEGTVRYHQDVSLAGILSCKTTKEQIINGTIVIYKNGGLKHGTISDFDGKYYIANIDPGTYEVVAHYIGYESVRLKDVVIKGKLVLNFELVESRNAICIYPNNPFQHPLIDLASGSSKTIIKNHNIKRLPY